MITRISIYLSASQHPQHRTNRPFSGGKQLPDPTLSFPNRLCERVNHGHHEVWQMSIFTFPASQVWMLILPHFFVPMHKV